MVPPTTATPPPTLPHAQELETFLRQLLAPGSQTPADTPPLPRPRGAPPVLPAFVLWAGLLVGLLRGLPYQRDLWRLLTLHGLWDFPRVDITDSGLYQRLQRTPPDQMQQFFTQLTAQLHAQLPPVSATDLAPFAPEIRAFDHTVLDPVLRKRKLFRDLPPGDAGLLPGALASVFDIRRQQWCRVDFVEYPILDMRRSLVAATADAPAGTLFLFDLGYFCFSNFDTLTERGYHYVTRLREKISFTSEHVFYHGPAGPPEDPEAVELWDGIIYLGAYRSDRAAQPVRLIEITVGGQTYRYLTNVLDPALLSAAEVAELYRRRWDIERAFDVLKTDLGLHLLWSGHRNTLLLQVYATLILAQILLALRNQVAVQAAVDVREVSLPLLIRWFPRLAAEGKDPVAEFVRVGRRAGYIRPFRGATRGVPQVSRDAYTPLSAPVPPRKARRRTGPDGPDRAPSRPEPPKRTGPSAYRPHGHKLK